MNKKTLIIALFGRFSGHFTTRTLVLGCLCCGLLTFFCLHVYSYKRQLELEQMLMPDRSSLSGPHVREISSGITTWKVTYRGPAGDVRYIDPSITVNLFGRVTDAASKEVWFEVDSYRKSGK